MQIKRLVLRELCFHERREHMSSCGRKPVSVMHFCMTFSKLGPTWVPVPLHMPLGVTGGIRKATSTRIPCLGEGSCGLRLLLYSVFGFSGLESACGSRVSGSDPVAQAGSPTSGWAPLSTAEKRQGTGHGHRGPHTELLGTFPSACTGRRALPARCRAEMPSFCSVTVCVCGSV